VGVQSLFLTTTIKNWRTAHNCVLQPNEYYFFFYFFYLPKRETIFYYLRETSTTYIYERAYVCVCAQTWRYTALYAPYLGLQHKHDSYNVFLGIEYMYIKVGTWYNDWNKHLSTDCNNYFLRKSTPKSSKNHVCNNIIILIIPTSRLDFVDHLGVSRLYLHDTSTLLW